MPRSSENQVENAKPEKFELFVPKEFNMIRDVYVEIELPKGLTDSDLSMSDKLEIAQRVRIELYKSKDKDEGSVSLDIATKDRREDFDIKWRMIEK